jgi:hypothetical protein
MAIVGTLEMLSLAVQLRDISDLTPNYYRISMKYTCCLLCREEISNSGFTRHIVSCAGQGKRRPPNGIGTGKWNKGQTKLTDSRILKSSIKSSITLTGRKGHKLTTSHKEILSKCAKNRGFGGTPKSKWVDYKGIKLGSSYEVTVAEQLDKNKIEWNRPKFFKYIDPTGKDRTYTPDFYLPQFNVYLDPKNDFLINHINPALGFSDKIKIQLVAAQNDINIVILSKDELRWEFILDKIMLLLA